MTSSSTSTSTGDNELLEIIIEILLLFQREDHMTESYPLTPLPLNYERLNKLIDLYRRFLNLLGKPNNINIVEMCDQRTRSVIRLNYIYNIHNRGLYCIYNMNAMELAVLIPFESLSIRIMEKLIANGVDIQSSINLLLLASFCSIQSANYKKTVLLVENGVNINQQDPLNYTCLSIQIEFIRLGYNRTGAMETIAYLLQNHASPYINIDSVSTSILNPNSFQLANETNNYELIELLHSYSN